MQASLKELTDEGVVELVQAGDMVAFGEIVRRYQVKLVRYATTITYDEMAAEDVVQNAFLKAYEHILSFSTKRKFSSWMYRIVHNSAIDYLRKHRREVAIQEHDWVLQLTPTQEDFEEDVALKMDIRDMYAKLALLPVSYRSVLSLYYLEEYSYAEISDVLRIPPGTVATRLNRGKKALAALYEAEKHE